MINKFSKYYLFLMPGGKSFLPISVAGFMAAINLKLGCLEIGFESDFSYIVTVPLDSSKLDKHCKVSADARFISSNKTQYPK